MLPANADADGGNRSRPRLSAAPGSNLRAEGPWRVSFPAFDPPDRREPGMAVFSALMGKEQRFRGGDV
jgi:hypothetical protein